MGNMDAYSGSVRGEYDWSTTAPSRAVIDALAALENVEPTHLPEVLDTTLFAHVHPDALNTLIADDSPISISFSVEDYLVQIDGTGLIVSYD